MTNPTPEQPQRDALIAGLCSAITIAQGIFDHIYVGNKILSSGAPALTVHNILAHASLYRFAFTADLIPVYAVVTMIFYRLFRVVSPGLSLLAAIFSLLGAAAGLTAGVFQFAPVVLLSRLASGVGGATTDPEILAFVFLSLREIAFTMSLMFFGAYCFAIGALGYRSRFMPRTIGGLMMSGGIAYCSYCVAYFAIPTMARLLADIALPLGSLGELALTVWLLAFGWKGRTSSAPLGS